MAKKKGAKKTGAKRTVRGKRAAVTQSQWDGTTFCFEGPNNGELLQGGPNHFKLDPILTLNGFKRIFKLVSVPIPDGSGPHGVTPFWDGVKLIWIPGKKFTMGFGPFNGTPAQEKIERQSRYDKAALQFEKPIDRIPYERLVGVATMLDGKSAGVTLFLAAKNHTDGTKGIILARADLPASPGDAAVGNG
jgi:hypothetical protein